MGMPYSEQWLRDCAAKGIIAGVKGVQIQPATNESVSEKEFQAAVESFAKRHGWLCYHTRDSRKSASGFPDCVFLRGPRIVIAELKVGDNQPTASQSTWLEAFAAAGIETHLWRPANWPQIIATLT